RRSSPERVLQSSGRTELGYWSFCGEAFLPHFTRSVHPSSTFTGAPSSTSLTLELWGLPGTRKCKFLYDAHSALRADSKRGYRWPCPRPHMRGNYLNINHKKCKFLYDKE